MIAYQIKVRALLSLIGMAAVLLLGGWWAVHPAYAATEQQIVCPADGNGSEDMLKAAIRAANMTSELDSIVISVTGADCLFTLVKEAENTIGMGLPVISGDLHIRAVGGHAIIERSANAPEFRLLRSPANLTLENLTLRNGISHRTQPNTYEPGGAIEAGRALTLTNVVLTNNTGDYGGAVYVAGPLVLNHVTASHNRTRSASQSDGGAIQVSGYLTATYITMTHNTGPHQGRGGGMAVYGSATISSAHFAGNQSVGNMGGGLYVYGNLMLSHSEFIGNSASDDGGGLYVVGDLTLSSSRFVSNSSGSDGGGVYVGRALSLTGTHFIRNVAAGAGGGLVEGNEIMASAQAEMAGATTKMASIEASSFISNQAAYGGGAHIQSGVVQNSLFETNVGQGSGSYYGGGGLMVAWQATIQNNRFVGNLAPFGGAVHLMFYPPSTPGAGNQIVNNLWIDNEASQGNGSAVAVGVDIAGFQGNYVEIKHNTFVRRTRSVGSAVYVARSTADITNNIITEHRIGIHAAGLSILTDGNLLYGNIINYTGVEGGPLDLIADPQFVDPANHDYHLESGSPAQDSGLALGVTADLDGVLRPQGKGYDRGAFESVPVNQTPLAQSDAYTTLVDTTLVITAPGVLANDSDPDGEPLTVTVATVPTHGELVLQPAGAFVYTPAAGFTGMDSFTYQASDGMASSAAITVSIEVKERSLPPAQPIAITGLRVTHDGPTTAGRTVNFVASVDAGSDVLFAWDFGDATTAEGATASHLYAQPGNYAVTISARNSLGRVQTVTEVIVLPDLVVQKKLFSPLIVK